MKPKLNCEIASSIAKELEIRERDNQYPSSNFCLAPDHLSGDDLFTKIANLKKVFDILKNHHKIVSCGGAFPFGFLYGGHPAISFSIRKL